MRYKITFIGSGNVATNLAIAFDKAGHTINQVVSRNLDNAKSLASKFGAYYGTTSSDIYNDSNVIIIAVSDDMYEEAVRLIPTGTSAIICHTSGPVSLSVLSEKGSQQGVIYPLQSLRKEDPTDLLNVPILIEASSTETIKHVYSLADSISNIVREVSSEDRAKYHLAAVFANNFTNALYEVSSSYLSKEGLDFNMLLPIIKETATRLKNGKPSTWQTGPAKRGDSTTMQRHIDMLYSKDAKDIYQQISQFIINEM